MDKDSGELLGEFSGHVAKDLCLESSVDCNDTQILSGSADGKLWIWDLATQKVVNKLIGDSVSKFPTVSISVHPQKNCILGSNGTKIIMWESISKEDE